MRRLCSVSLMFVLVFSGLAYAQNSEDSINLNEYAQSVGGPGSSTYEAMDVVENVDFSQTICIDFDALTVAGEDRIELINSSGIHPMEDIKVQLDEHGVTIRSSTEEIVKYELSGNLTGTLTVYSDSDYQLYLNGLSVTASAGPAFNLQSKKRSYIVLAAESVSSLEDTADRDEELDQKAALYSKGRIILSGSGSLTVKAHYKHAVSSSDLLRIRSGSLSIHVDARDGIRTDNGFIFDYGNLIISGTGTIEDEESKGIKVDGTEKAPGKGSIVINGGYITIDTVGKAMSAGWDIDEDAQTAETSDDPDPDLKVNNGILRITTTGTPYERTTSEGLAISCSPEGLEAKSDLIINNGYLILNTTDDSLNAGSSITINGGYVYAFSSANDAIDSNGTLTVSGAVIVAVGTSAPEGPFDCDTNTFTVSGGLLIGIGGMTSLPTEATCTQPVIITGSFAKGDRISLETEEGDMLFSLLLPASAPSLVFSAPQLKIGGQYRLLKGGSVSGATIFQNLYHGILQNSGGQKLKAISIQSMVTQAGGMIFNMGPGGQARPGMFGERDGRAPGARPPQGFESPEGFEPPENFSPFDSQEEK